MFKVIDLLEGEPLSKSHLLQLLTSCRLPPSSHKLWHCSPTLVEKSLPTQHFKSSPKRLIKHVHMSSFTCLVCSTWLVANCKNYSIWVFSSISFFLPHTNDKLGECMPISCTVNRFAHLSCESLQVLQSYVPLGCFSN
ncbi:hypothetical protein AMECASPLE_011843 [Ameca splendens]|uniref:Uncharacterized protein n=1 Tax=Ameca splendens TaxID=208324 RepID=A0ABV0Y169_9TELE